MRGTPGTSCQSRRAAFTLIEMLVVVSIVSILLGLLYGALERSQKFSRRTVTYTEIKNIETALKQYHAHYHAWPTNLPTAKLFQSENDIGFILDREIADMLMGSVNAGNQHDMDRFNPQHIPFIELLRYSKEQAGQQYLINPFKITSNDPETRAYKVLFDTNGDRQITIDDNNYTTNIIADLAVWTLIPGSRRTDSTGREEPVGEVVFGSWQPFNRED